MLSTVLSVMMLAIVALLLGAFALWRRGGSRKQVSLMLVLSLVIAVNVAIWAVPGAQGEAPVRQELR